MYWHYQVIIPDIYKFYLTFIFVTVILYLVNCLEEEIPESLCNLKLAQVLSLNGLGKANGCSDTLTIPLLETSWRTSNDVEVPPCLWSLQNLTTLHLTGNSYIGTIPASESKASRLNDLSLSHNKITGTIPSFVQSMTTVDISHNRLVGNLHDIKNTSNESVLHAQVNRLSGRLPVHALEKIPSIDILRGNMFSCETIPENDVSSYGYICGNGNEEHLCCRHLANT